MHVKEVNFISVAADLFCIIVFLIALTNNASFASKESGPGDVSNLLLYENSEIGVRAQYPETWDVFEMCCKGSYGYTNFSPRDAEGEVILRLEYVGEPFVSSGLTLDSLVPELENPTSKEAKGDDFILLDSGPFALENESKETWRVTFEHNPLEIREDTSPVAEIDPEQYYQQEGTPTEYVTKVLVLDQGIQATFKYSSTDKQAFEEYLPVAEQIIHSFGVDSSPSPVDPISDSASISSTKTDLAQTNISFSTYENKNYGIEIQYPSNWSFDDYEDPLPNATVYTIVDFYPPISQDPGLTTEFYVNVEDLGGPYTVDEYTRDAVDFYRNTSQGFKLESVSTPNPGLLGMPSYLIEFTDESEEEGVSKKNLDTGVILGDKAVYIFFGSEASTYDSLLPTVNRMIDSLKLAPTSILGETFRFGAFANLPEDEEVSNVSDVDSAVLGDFPEYRNDSMDLTLNYPSNWTVQEEGYGRVKFTSPITDSTANTSGTSASLEVVTYPTPLKGNQEALDAFANESIESLKPSVEALTIDNINEPDIKWSKGTFIKGITFTYAVGGNQYKALQVYQWEPSGVDKDFVYVTTISSELSEFDKILNEVASALSQSNSMNFRIMTPEIQVSESARLEGLDECDDPTSQDAGWAERCGLE